MFVYLLSSLLHILICLPSSGLEQWKNRQSLDRLLFPGFLPDCPENWTQHYLGSVVLHRTKGFLIFEWVLVKIPVFTTSPPRYEVAPSSLALLRVMLECHMSDAASVSIKN